MLFIQAQFLSNHSQQIMVNGCHIIVPSVHRSTFSILENKLFGYAKDSKLIVDTVVPSPGSWVAVQQSLNCDLWKVSEWCDLYGMKLNVSKTKTMIVPRSAMMHPQSPPWTIGGTVLNGLMTLIYWDSHLVTRWYLRTMFTQFLEQLLKCFYLEEILKSI